MTRLCLDPGGLSLLFPKASPAYPQKIRIIGQVFTYDETTAILHVGRVANLAPVHVHISLDEDEENTNSSVCVDVTDVVYLLGPQTTAEGVVVSIWGMYDGNVVRAVECSGVNGQELLGGSVSVLAEVSTLREI